MTDEEAARQLEGAGRAFLGEVPDETQEAIRRGAHALRCRGPQVEALEHLRTDVTNITGTEALDFVRHMERVDVDGRVLEALLEALALAKETP